MQPPESNQVRPKSLKTFKPSYASSKIKNKNDALRKRISDFESKHWFPCGADGRSVGRSVYGYVIIKFQWDG